MGTNNDAVAKNLSETAAKIARLRREGIDDGVRVAYLIANTTPRGFPGDEDAPWVKDVAFAKNTIEYFDVDLADQPASLIGPAIDVRNARLFTLYIDFFDDSVAPAELQWLPLALALDDPDVDPDLTPGNDQPWIPLAAVDPAALNTGNEALNTVRQQFYTSSPTDGSTFLAQSFPVSAFTHFRFVFDAGAADIGFLRTRYNLSY